MISTQFEYSRATSLDDALAKLRAANGEGKLIAGGHSLVPLMKLRLSEPKTLIDIARIPGLSGISKKGDKIEIGAGTVHHDVATSALLQEACPMLRVELSSEHLVDRRLPLDRYSAAESQGVSLARAADFPSDYAKRMYYYPSVSLPAATIFMRPLGLAWPC